MPEWLNVCVARLARYHNLHRKLTTRQVPQEAGKLDHLAIFLLPADAGWWVTAVQRWCKMQCGMMRTVS